MLIDQLNNSIAQLKDINMVLEESLHRVGEEKKALN